MSAEALTESLEPPCLPELVGSMKAVVAGAGPAGALTAIFLAKQGYSVDVRLALSTKRKTIPCSVQETRA